MTFPARMNATRHISSAEVLPSMAKPSTKLIFPLVSLSFLSVIALLLVVPFARSPPTRPLGFSRVRGLRDSSPPSPRIAYLISGSDGDGDRVLRLLRAVYHPGNWYLLQLDLRAPQRQRENLASAVQAVDIFRAAGNVNVVGKAGYANLEGSTAIAAVLHGASVLLRQSKEWDWFLNLAASDYPLITQDDFLHVLSFVPRNLNFIQHTDDIGWKESRRVHSIIVDPGLYLAARRDIFHGSQKRPLPTAYKFFTGSSSMILSRKLVEFSILGWDNLPRMLLMYFSNMKSAQRGYFHTLLCNSKNFHNTVVNSDLKFNSWNISSSERIQNLKLNDFDKMINSGAAFAGSFLPNDPVLDKIDSTILYRSGGRTAPGGWCLGRSSRGRDPCLLWGDPGILRPGPGANRFEQFLLKSMKNSSSSSNVCSSS